MSNEHYGGDGEGLCGLILIFCGALLIALTIWAAVHWHIPLTISVLVVIVLYCIRRLWIINR